MEPGITLEGTLRLVWTPTTPVPATLPTVAIHLYSTVGRQAASITHIKPGSPDTVPFTYTGRATKDVVYPYIQANLVVLAFGKALNRFGLSYVAQESSVVVEFGNLASATQPVFPLLTFDGLVSPWGIEIILSLPSKAAIPRFLDMYRQLGPSTRVPIPKMTPERKDALYDKYIGDDYPEPRYSPSFKEIRITLFPWHRIQNTITEAWVFFQDTSELVRKQDAFLYRCALVATLVVRGYDQDLAGGLLDIDRHGTLEERLAWLQAFAQTFSNSAIYRLDTTTRTGDFTPNSTYRDRKGIDALTSLIATASYAHPAGDCEDLAKLSMAIWQSLGSNKTMRATIPALSELAGHYQVYGNLVDVSLGKGDAHMTVFAIPRDTAPKGAPLLCLDGIFPMRHAAPYSQATISKLTTLQLRIKDLLGQGLAKVRYEWFSLEDFTTVRLFPDMFDPSRPFTGIYGVAPSVEMKNNPTVREIGVIYSRLSSRKDRPLIYDPASQATNLALVRLQHPPTLLVPAPTFIKDIKRTGKAAPTNPYLNFFMVDAPDTRARMDQVFQNEAYLKKNWSIKSVTQISFYFMETMKVHLLRVEI